MNKQIKQVWVDALRSGLYAQGMGLLRDFNDKFCCLGVLCDVTDRGVWEKQAQQAPHRFCLRESESSHPEILSESFITVPGKLADEVDLSTSDINELMSMNDTGKSFAEIADWIEQNT